MKKLLIAIKNFDSRFPQAAAYLNENAVQFTVCESIASLSDAEKQEQLYNADALFIAAEPVGADLLDRMPNLKIISRMGSGMDNIDLNQCKAHGIVVSNSRGCNSNSVAEHTLLLILSSLRNTRRMTTAAINGQWSERTAVTHEELYGKTVGLIGFGGIARRLAEMLVPFNARVIAYDPFMDKEKAAELNVESVSFDVLLVQSEIISVHIPATPENIGLFNKAMFDRMLKKPYFINCSRGSLVIEDDLYHALKDGTLRAAATDVWAKEPVEANNKLFEMSNFMGTPHIAGMSAKSALDDSMTVVRSIVSCLNGQPVDHRVV